MTRVMDSKEIELILTRMTHEILERNRGCEGLVLVGIRTGGVYLSARLSKIIRRVTGKEIPTGTMDITLYRDDLSRIGYAPMVKKTEIQFSIDKKVVILVDDVLYTGRTIRAAMDALIDLGRPRQIQLAVLIDRGLRELPISADYIGKRIETSPEEIVDVLLKEGGMKEDGVILRKKHAAEK